MNLTELNTQVNSKICIKCNIEKPQTLDNFYKHKISGSTIMYKGTCKECFKVAKKERGCDPLKNREYASTYYNTHTEKAIHRVIKNYIKKKHGIEIC